MQNESENFFQCPYCGERVSMVFEELYGNQSYIEDCEVCCNPIEISFQIQDGVIANVTAERAQ